MAKLKDLVLAARYSKLWEQCWDPEVCIKIPFSGKKCLGAHVSVRIVEDNGVIYLEGEINGSTSRYALSEGCIPPFTVGIASLEICVAALDMQVHALRGLTLTIKASIAAKIGPIELNECWDLFDSAIRFFHVTGAELRDLLGVSNVRLDDFAWSNAKFVTHSTSAVSDSDRVCHCRL